MTRRLRLEAFASEVKAAKRRAAIIDRYRMSACRERFSGGRAAPGQRIWAAASVRNSTRPTVTTLMFGKQSRPWLSSLRITTKARAATAPWERVSTTRAKIPPRLSCSRAWTFHLWPTLNSPTRFQPRFLAAETPYHRRMARHNDLRPASRYVAEAFVKPSKREESSDE